MTETNPKITADIDVGKTQQELSINQRRPHPNLRQRTAVHRRPDLELPRQPEPIALAVYEPTGGYERLLATMLAEAGLPASRLHPDKVRA